MRMLTSFYMCFAKAFVHGCENMGLNAVQYRSQYGTLSFTVLNGKQNYQIPPTYLMKYFHPQCSCLKRITGGISRSAVLVYVAQTLYRPVPHYSCHCLRMNHSDKNKRRLTEPPKLITLLFKTYPIIPK